MKKNNTLAPKHSLTSSRSLRRGYRLYSAMVLILAVVVFPAFADDNEVITVVNNLSDFIFGLIRSIGLIILGFGVLQIGMSLKSHDPSQRANGFLSFAGGLIITFTKEILTLITGG